jgi:hypothetical protein
MESMATTTIFCPACNYKLRVPDNLMGQQVQCPKCAAMFTAPPPLSLASKPPEPDERFSEGLPPEAAAVPSRRFDEREDDRREWEEFDRPPPASSAKVVVPAIFMLILAFGVLIDAVYRLFTALFAPKVLEDAMANMQQMMPGFPAGDPKVALITTGVLGGFSLVLALLMFAGGIAMLRRKMYGLAVTGSIASMLTLNCCCVPGLAIGIWSLLILMQSDVKQSFS